MVLTGTSRGIGRFLAEYYAEKGWNVAGCSREETDFKHPNYRHDRVDVTASDQVVPWIHSVVKQFGAIDAAINNAGSASMNHSLLTPDETVDRLFNVNFKGTFLVCREVGKQMQRSRYGRIVNFSSIATSMALEGESIYAATKSAVVTFSRAMAREVATRNITVNVVAPPPIKTDLNREIPDEIMQKLIDRMVIHRYGEFEDVANICDFFIGRDNSMVTGQVITLGGW
jgi:3-oxoacyl-[acyl-carrier protein] reductase